MSREPMKTVGGMSVRAEIEARLALQREEVRTSAIEECISFLAKSGYVDAAEILQRAAFERTDIDQGALVEPRN